MRHNKVRDVLAKKVAPFFKDTAVEPAPHPLNGESLAAGANTSNEEFSSPNPNKNPPPLKLSNKLSRFLLDLRQIHNLDVVCHADHLIFLEFCNPRQFFLLFSIFHLTKYSDISRLFPITYFRDCSPLTIFEICPCNFKTRLLPIISRLFPLNRFRDMSPGGTCIENN